MLREKRRHTNYKPNRRLDAKSSRGMIYENEELRLRTININAEVERGQSDIRKLKKENDHLRSVIWNLRDEYEKLENILKVSNGLENNENANVNRLNFYKSCMLDDKDEDESHPEDDYDCEDEDGDNNYSDEEDDSYNSHSNESCISCLNDEKSVNDKLKIPLHVNSHIISGVCSTNKNNMSSKIFNSSYQNISKRDSKHHVNFDHLSIVSEENLATGDVISNNNNSNNNSNNNTLNSSNTKNNDTLYRRNYDFNSSLNDIQSIVPSLQHFENIPYETLGPNVDSQGQIMKLEKEAGRPKQLVDNERITTPTRIKPIHFFSPIKVKRAEEPSCSSAVYKVPVTSAPYIQEIKELKQLQQPLSSVLLNDTDSYKATGPDICINDVLACDSLTYMPLCSHHSLSPLPMTELAIESSTPASSPPNTPGGHFRNGGNLEELLLDIGVLSYGLQNMNVTNEFINPTVTRNGNQPGTKPYKSEINLFLAYPENPSNLNKNASTKDDVDTLAINTIEPQTIIDSPLSDNHSNTRDNNSVAPNSINHNSTTVNMISTQAQPQKTTPIIPLLKSTSPPIVPKLTFTPSAPQTNQSLIIPSTQAVSPIVSDKNHSEDNNCICNNVSENNSINNIKIDVNNNSANVKLPRKFSYNLPATIKRRLFAKKSISTSVTNSLQNNNINIRDKETEPLTLSNSNSNLTSSLQPVAMKDDASNGVQKNKRRVSIYFNGKKPVYDKEKKSLSPMLGSGGNVTIEGNPSSESCPSTPIINLVESVGAPSLIVPHVSLNRRLSLDNIGINSTSLLPLAGKNSDGGSGRVNGRRHSTSHHHHNAHANHRKMSIDSSKANFGSGLGVTSGLISNTMSRCNSGKSLISIKKRSRSDSIHHDHHDGGGGGGNTSYSERNSNSFASSRESSTSLSIKSHKSRRISITSHSATGKIPWCGCWGNGCI